jgi:hypothetical protein
MRAILHISQYDSMEMMQSMSMMDTERERALIFLDMSRSKSNLQAEYQ